MKEDSNNCRTDQGPPAGGGMDGGDWRTQLQQDSRERNVNKITETLKRHLPFAGQDGLQELKKIAIRFEEKIYAAATSQSDYLRKMSLKMLAMEIKSQNSMANSLQSNAASNSKTPQEAVASGLGVVQAGTPNQEGLPLLDLNVESQEADAKPSTDDDALESIVRAVCGLQHGGHVTEEFRLKFLTWISLKATDHERKVVTTFVRTMIDDPNSLAGQLLHIFSDMIQKE